MGSLIGHVVTAGTADRGRPARQQEEHADYSGSFKMILKRELPRKSLIIRSIAAPFLEEGNSAPGLHHHSVDDEAVQHKLLRSSTTSTSMPSAEGGTNTKRRLDYARVHAEAQASKRRYLVITFILCPSVVVVFLLFVCCRCPYCRSSNHAERKGGPGEEEENVDSGGRENIPGIAYYDDEESSLGSRSDTETVVSISIDAGEQIPASLTPSIRVV